MSDDLRIQGTLAETTVPDLFRSLIRSGETGIVTLDAIGRHDTIFFQDGRIVFGASSDSDLGLAEVLLRSGDLNLDQYTRATEDVFGSRRIAAVLMEMGFLQRDELTRALERQVSTIVDHALSFRTGSYTIDFTAMFPAETPTLTLNTERLILDGVARIEHWSLIQRGLNRMSRLLRHSRNADTRIFQLDLTEEESHVYALLTEPQTAMGVCERSYLSNFATCRTLWALLSVNLIEDAEEGEQDAQREAVETELELEALVERYNASFQSIFGLVFQRIGDHVYDFMDRVVQHLSPEVLPYLSGINLINEARVDFDQLLDNLVASGSEDRRSVVTAVLNELLYGWIYEIRKEFGNALEPEMAAIMSRMKGS